MKKLEDLLNEKWEEKFGAKFRSDIREEKKITFPNQSITFVNFSNNN